MSSVLVGICVAERVDTPYVLGTVSSVTFLQRLKNLHLYKTTGLMRIRKWTKSSLNEPLPS